MIQLPNIITTPQINSQSFDGIWLSNITINAPNPVGTVTAVIGTIPFNSTDGTLAPRQYGIPIYIDDVFSASYAQPSIGVAMGAIFGAIQELIVSRSIYTVTQ